MTTKILSGIYGAAYNLTSPVTTLSITASGYLGAGLFSAGLGTYTIVNAGVVRGGFYAISLAGSGIVTNASTIRAASTTKGVGVALEAGGSVTNSAGARISGFGGVFIAANPGTVNNQGLIAANGHYGVALAAGGLVTNGGTANTVATIQGVVAVEAGQGATLHNYGTLTGVGTSSTAGYFKAGGLVTNGSAGDKSAAMSGSVAGIQFNGAAGTLINYGSIRATGTSGIGVGIFAGGVVTNGSAADTTALIQAAGVGIVAVTQAGTVNNFGAIISGAGAAVAAVYLEKGGTVTNGSAADTTAAILAATVGVGIGALAGEVTNYGVIEATGLASFGAFLHAGGTVTNGSGLDTTALIKGTAVGIGVSTTTGTVNNFGTVMGGYTPAAMNFGVLLTVGGFVTNGSTGDTKARIGGYIGVYIESEVGAVTNFGTISGKLIGVALQEGGRVVNGAAADTTALIQGYIGVLGENVSVTVQNFGAIKAGGGPGTLTFQEAAVELFGGGSITNGSSTDAKALMSGEIGISTKNIAATVSNFGSVVGDFVGVYMTGGGRVINGSASDTGASIVGTNAGVDISVSVATVINFGTIRGGQVAYVGVGMVNGGAVTNGSATDHAALIYGFIGVLAEGATVVTNNATISGNLAIGSFGVDLSGTTKLTNNAGAMITGHEGVIIRAGCTASNFGVISGLDGVAVQLTDPTARLNLEAGSTLIGEIGDKAGGVLDVVGGVATANGISLGGKLTGAGTLALSNDAFIYAGASLSVAKIAINGAKVFVETKLTDSHVWAQSSGTLSVESSNQMTFTGAGNTFSGTVTGTGAVVLSGGSDTLSNVTLSAGKMTINKAAVTFGGAVVLTGTLSATSTSLVVAAGGATFSGGGELLLSNNATNSLKGASSAATLTNKDTIRGAGLLGGGTMTLVNAAGGIIEGVGSAGLIIDTGANTVTNAGTIEALTGNVTTIAGAVANTGLLASNGGTLAVSGAVTGTGIVHVFGGVVSFLAAFNEHVSFGSTGRLVLAHSTAFTGTVSGFSHTGTTSFDLKDINFASATSSFSGTTTSGILTVTDGTHTAHLHLTGDYTAAAWVLSNDGTGGTIVVDPTAPKPHAIVSAMAGMGAGPAVSHASHAPPPAAALLFHAP